MRKDPITYNAKGDLVGGSYPVVGIFQTVRFTFNASGAITTSPSLGTLVWVETTPTPPAWIRPSNYEITSIETTQSGGGIAPPVGSNMSTSPSFSLANPPMGQVRRHNWDVVVRNIATNETALFTIRLMAENT